MVVRDGAAAAAASQTAGPAKPLDAVKGFYRSKMQPSFSGLATATKKAATKTGVSLRGVFAPKGPGGHT